MFKRSSTTDSHSTESGEAGRAQSGRDIRSLLELVRVRQEELEQEALDGPCFALSISYELVFHGDDRRWLVLRCFSVSKQSGAHVSEGYDVVIVETRTGDAYQCLDGNRRGRLKFSRNVFGTRPTGICFLK